MLFDPEKDPLGSAMQLDAFGFAGVANERYADAIARGGAGAETAVYLQRRLIRRRERETSRAVPWVAVHLDSAQNGRRARPISEGTWINYLLGNLAQQELFVDELKYLPTKVIIHASLHVSEEYMLFLLKKCFHEGISTIFITGDEWYRFSFDFLSNSARYCDLIINTCFSPHMEMFGNTIQIPFGLGNPQFPAYPPDWRSKSASERDYFWSFAGDPNKSTRKAMLAEMGRYGGGFQRLTSGWMAADALGPQDYRALLENSLFSPCPAGWANVDSYRVWESLEAGCIPIVERRDFDYFTLVGGRHPMPTLRDWQEVHSILEPYREREAAEELRGACVNWWAGYKQSLRSKIAGIVSEL